MKEKNQSSIKVQHAMWLELRSAIVMWRILAPVRRAGTVAAKERRLRGSMRARRQWVNVNPGRRRDETLGT